jgi:hypothetical protein
MCTNTSTLIVRTVTDDGVGGSHLLPHALLPGQSRTVRCFSREFYEGFALLVRRRSPIRTQSRARGCMRWHSSILTTGWGTTSIAWPNRCLRRFAVPTWTNSLGSSASVQTWTEALHLFAHAVMSLIILRSRTAMFSQVATNTHKQKNPSVCFSKSRTGGDAELRFPS